MHFNTQTPPTLLEARLDEDGATDEDDGGGGSDDEDGAADDEGGATEEDAGTEDGQLLITPPLPVWASHVVRPIQLLLFSQPQPEL